MKAMGSHIRHKAIQQSNVFRDMIMMVCTNLPSMKSCLVGNKASSMDLGAGRRGPVHPLNIMFVEGKSQLIEKTKKA